MSSRLIGICISLASAYVVLGFVFGQLTVVGQPEWIVVSGQVWKIIAVGLLFIGGWLWWREELEFSLGAFLFAFGGLALTDYITRRFTYLTTSTTLFDALVVALGITSLIVAGTWGVRDRIEALSRLFSPLTLIAVQVVLSIFFLREMNGSVLWSDDHPSFLYRLALLYQHFPAIPYYNGDWNAGYQAREFFPSGVLNTFLLGYPFVFFANGFTAWESAKIYNLLIPYLFVFIIPWSSYVACRVLRLSSLAAAIAGFLSLATSITFFEWMLKYGTMGFSVSCGLLPLALALAYRLGVDEEEPRWIHAVGLLFVGTCCLYWSLSFLALTPVLLIALSGIRRLLRPNRLRILLFFSIAFSALNAPWIVTFFRESKVTQFVAQDTLPGSQSQNFRGTRADDLASRTIIQHVQHSHDQLKELLIKIHPGLLLLVLPGIWLFPHRLRFVYGSTLLWLIFVGAIGEEFKPQLELRRLLTVASALAVLPVSLALSRFLTDAADQIRHASILQRAQGFAGLVVAVAAIALAPLTAAAAYTEKTSEKFRPAPAIVSDLISGLRAYGGEGRIFFLGFILHDLGAQSYKSQDGGHIAPFPLWVGKPMIASHYYHAKWSEIDPIPIDYRRRGPEGIEEFLDLMNATSVVTFRTEWVDYCRNNSRYTEVWHEGRFRIFRRTPAANGYFLRGTGKILSGVNERGLSFVPESDEVVLKFRYLPGLRLSDPTRGEIFPVPVFVEDSGGGRMEEVNYIGFRRRNAGEVHLDL